MKILFQILFVFWSSLAMAYEVMYSFETRSRIELVFNFFNTIQIRC